MGQRVAVALADPLERLLGDLQPLLCQLGSIPFTEMIGVAVVHYRALMARMPRNTSAMTSRTSTVLMRPP